MPAVGTCTFERYSILAFLLWVALAGCAGRSAAGDRPAHHTESGYRNLADLPPRSFLDFLSWRFGLGPEEEPPISYDIAIPYKPAVVPPNLNHLGHPDPREIQLTWVGHATYLIQVGGLNLLTDPMYSDRASPVSFAGPRRHAPPGIPFGSLPPIDVVIISHNHYDHLDEKTVKRLGNGPKYLVPLGIGGWLEKRGITNVQEMDWGDSLVIGPLRFHAVPLQHFSSRSLFDRNETLWMGMVIESEPGNIFFAGDTGYAPLFQAIGKTLGPMRLSLIPIGAYRPRWFMGDMHVDPPQAVQIHEDVRSALSVGIHWGTFGLTDEPLGEPPVYLAKALRDAGIERDRFIVMKIGETIVLQ